MGATRREKGRGPGIQAKPGAKARRERCDPCLLAVSIGKLRRSLTIGRSPRFPAGPGTLTCLMLAKPSVREETTESSGLEGDGDDVG